jgi:hypothetical protein
VFDVVTWNDFYAPAGMQQDAMDTLNKALLAQPVR